MGHSTTNPKIPFKETRTVARTVNFEIEYQSNERRTFNILGQQR
jgi:hypothetical protein